MPSRSALTFASILAVTLVTSCRENQPQRWDMLSPSMLSHWKAAEIAGSGATKIKVGEVSLGAGEPMTAVRFSAWETQKLPVTDYAIEFEALRDQGQDFFGAITFPVRSLSTCATLVNGGWGGGLVGISNIDEQTANENATRSEHRFVNGQWYRFRVEVRSEEIRGWLDGRLIINASIKGRSISLRAGDIERCAPFGVATYGSAGKVRGLVVETLR